MNNAPGAILLHILSTIFLLSQSKHGLSQPIQQAMLSAAQILLEATLSGETASKHAPQLLQLNLYAMLCCAQLCCVVPCCAAWSCAVRLCLTVLL